jgi:transcription elongation factor Elf1
MKDLKSFVKRCVAEVVVEPTDEGKLTSLAMAGLLGVGAMKAAHHMPSHSDDPKPAIHHIANPNEELPSEKDMDSWNLAGKYSANKEKVAKGLNPLMKMTNFVKECIAEVIIEPIPRKMKVYGNPRRLQASHLIKECIMEVLKDNLLSEGFDPQSQGPNMPQENPYPEMNNKMRMMEAEPPNKDAWKQYEKGYNNGQAHKRSGIKPSGTMDNAESAGYHDALKGKGKSSPDVVRKTVKETDSGEIATNPHGRYAQQSAAGQFDPVTFGKLNFDGVDESSQTQSTSVEWTCPHCGKSTEIPVEIESPSDYIACADCDHCGKEISDPRLDQKVYAKVIDYYAGKADYQKDTSVTERKKDTKRYPNQVEHEKNVERERAKREIDRYYPPPAKIGLHGKISTIK